MSDIALCAKSFLSLLNIEYEFVIAKKGEKKSLKIIFNKTHFYHLAGLHYLVDIQCLRGDREKIFDKLVNQEITNQEIQKSRFYNKITPRIEKLIGLENFFDSDDTIFKYNPNTNVFSLINAEYLLENSSSNLKVFAFIDQNPDGNYFCRSFFPQEKLDYSKGQIKWTLLLKKKIIKATGNEIILYTKP